MKLSKWHLVLFLFVGILLFLCGYFFEKLIVLVLDFLTKVYQEAWNHRNSFLLIVGCVAVMGLIAYLARVLYCRVYSSRTNGNDRSVNYIRTGLSPEMYESIGFIRLLMHSLSDDSEDNKLIIQKVVDTRSKYVALTLETVSNGLKVKSGAESMVIVFEKKITGYLYTFNLPNNIKFSQRWKNSECEWRILEENRQLFCHHFVKHINKFLGFKVVMGHQILSGRRNSNGFIPTCYIDQKLFSMVFTIPDGNVSSMSHEQNEREKNEETTPLLNSENQGTENCPRSPWKSLELPKRSTEEDEIEGNKKVEKGKKRGREEKKKDIQSTSVIKMEEDADENMEGGEEKDPKTYCLCQCDKEEEMVFCENPSCKYEWYHFSCIGMQIAPVGDWYCTECREYEQSIKKEEEQPGPSERKSGTTPGRRGPKKKRFN